MAIRMINFTLALHEPNIYNLIVSLFLMNMMV